MKDVLKRCCEFRSCLAYYDGEEVQFFQSKSPGIIAENIRGCDNEISGLTYGTYSPQINSLKH